MLFLVAGVIAFISPENTFAAIADILGFLFLMVGTFWIIQAFGERDVNELWWFGLISGIAMIMLAFWTGGQFFIHRVYVLLVFAGIWALFHGVNDLIRAFQIRALGKLVEEGLERDDRVDLDVRALGQRGDRDRHARGRVVAAEELAVDLVHAREVAHVGEVDGAAERVREGRRRPPRRPRPGSEGSAESDPRCHP